MLLVGRWSAHLLRMKRNRPLARDVEGGAISIGTWFLCVIWICRAAAGLVRGGPDSAAVRAGPRDCRAWLHDGHSASHTELTHQAVTHNLVLIVAWVHERIREDKILHE